MGTGIKETLEEQVFDNKKERKSLSLFHIGIGLIILSIILFAISMTGSLIKIWPSFYSIGMTAMGTLSLGSGYAIRNKTIDPQSNDKTYVLINSIYDIVSTNFVEKDIKTIPVYDTSKYGELVSFIPPQDFDVVQQTWVSPPYTLVTILNNRRTHRNIYHISEPKLTDFENALLERIYDSLKIFLLDHEIDFNRMDKELILYNNYIRILDVYGIDLEPTSLQKIWYHLKRDYVGYGKLDVLIKDRMIEDISCDGADIPVYLYHRKYTNIETTIVFEEEELNMLILKLAQTSGKSISTGYPIMNAQLPDGSRLEATLGREVTTRGGTITIRKFREEPFTPVDLIKYGTLNTDVMAYLWLAVENNKNIIIVGETAAGKTTTLNAISLFIPSESKIVTIEDTRELTLNHKNWIPATVRAAYMGQEAADIDMFELLRSALRQRPEYMLVGEIRGKEAYTLFQAMSTGHTTFSTMHAGSIQTAVNRLLSEPINVPLMMLSALDIMVIQVLRSVGGRRARRVDVVSEFVGINPATGDISTRELYRWNPLHDVIELNGTSNVLDEIMTGRGWTKEKLTTEIENRKIVLHYLADGDINDYRDVTKVIERYTDNPGEVMDIIREGKTLLNEERT